jgi:hypothetical protein
MRTLAEHLFIFFAALKMHFLPSREILNSRTTGFMSGTVWHFGHLKI